jgi:hypothetical protein
MKDDLKERLDAMADDAKAQTLQERLGNLASLMLHNPSDNEALSAMLMLKTAMAKEGWHAKDAVFGDDTWMHRWRGATQRFEKERKKLIARIEFLSQHVTTDVLRQSRHLDDYLWPELADLASAKLGASWRTKLAKAVGVTTRRVELWESAGAVITDDAFAALRRLRDLPEREPEPPPPRAADPKAPSAERASLQPDMGHNEIKGLAINDLFALGREHLKEFERGAHNATAHHGIIFGRTAREAISRFKADYPGRRPKGAPKQKDHIMQGFLRDISTINRWISAANIVDDPDVPWSAVEAWAVESCFTTRESGAAKIKAMRAAYDAATQPD